MRKLRSTFSFLILVLAGFFALSCGTSQSPSSQLQFITLSPEIADAQSYPGGLVPFTATGYYTNPPLIVTPLPATWQACQQNQPTTDISVTQEGVAQCASGATGAYSVHASDFTGTDLPCPAILACGGAVPGCTVVGTAELTCP